jgi:hypothetical protein
MGEDHSAPRRCLLRYTGEMRIPCYSSVVLQVTETTASAFRALPGDFAPYVKNEITASGDQYVQYPAGATKPKKNS